MESYSNKVSIKQMICILTIILVGMPAALYADVTIPNTFTSGSTISSSQVNANFSTLANAMPAVKSTNMVGALLLVTSTGSPTQQMNSITITPPTDGQLIVTADGGFRIQQAVAAANYVISYLSNTQNGTTHGTQLRVDTAGKTAINDMYVPLHQQGVFAVIGGVATTIYLTAYRDSSGVNSCWILNPNLIAVFIPNTLP